MEHSPGQLHRALIAVLAIEPPEINSGDDPAMHEMLTEGFTTATDAVRAVVVDVLGADSPVLS